MIIRCAVLIAVILLTTQAFGTPVVFWASDPVKPGEAAMLIGHGFREKPAIKLFRLNDDPNGSTIAAALRSSASVEVDALQSSDQSVKFVVPAGFDNGVFKVRVTTTEGSADSLLNSPTVYWVQGDRGLQASPGGWIRIFGRCLGHKLDKTTLLMISNNSHESRRIKANLSDTWEAQFKVPADIKSDVYSLKLYNGWGDNQAWTNAGDIEVKVPDLWPDKTFNVKDFGAFGTGDRDDTKAILQAIEAANKNEGGVVYFPRGRYVLTKPLIIPRFTTLRGERRNLISITWADMKEPPFALLQGSNHFAIENLTFYASHYRHFIAGDLKETEAGRPGHVRLQHIRVRVNIYRGHPKPAEVDQRFRTSLKLSTGGGDTIRLGGENLVITDSDFYGSGRSLYLFQPRGAYVARNDFYNGRWGWYSISGANGLVFEHNRIIGADLMSTGGGINNLGGNAYSQNVFYAHNKLNHMHGWDREAITSDAGGGLYHGQVEEITAKTLKLVTRPSDKLKRKNWKSKIKQRDWKGAGVFILSGKGMGQFAQVDRLEDDVIYLDRPWKVLPDKFSIVTITMMQQNYLFINNQFTDIGAAIQYHGTSVNHVAAGNRATRTRGFYNLGLVYHHSQPSWFCQFLDNDIVEGNFYQNGINVPEILEEAVLGTFSKKRPKGAPLVLGTIHRRNHLHANAHLEINGFRRSYRENKRHHGINLKPKHALPGIREVIVEGNIVEHADIGLKIKGSIGVLQRKNVFKHVKQPIIINSQPYLIPAK